MKKRFTSMNRKGFFLIVIGIVVVVFLLAAGGAWYYEAHETRVDSSNSSSTAEAAAQSVTQTAAQNNASNWGTYTNYTAGIEFQYPANFQEEIGQGYELVEVKDGTGLEITVGDSGLIKGLSEGWTLENYASYEASATMNAMKVSVTDSAVFKVNGLDAIQETSGSRSDADCTESVATDIENNGVIFGVSLVRLDQNQKEECLSADDLGLYKNIVMTFKAVQNDAATLQAQKQLTIVFPFDRGYDSVVTSSPKTFIGHDINGKEWTVSYGAAQYYENTVSNPTNQPVNTSDWLTDPNTQIMKYNPSEGGGTPGTVEVTGYLGANGIFEAQKIISYHE